MIVSASYKTDIPTFYGEWFINRLNAGQCKVINPYNRRPFVVSLRREDVDGFIFWTKNVGPFLSRLAEVHKRGYPFVVQYTINAYPRSLEFSVVDAERSINQMRAISDKYGPRVAVWRYDTIVITSATSFDFHRRNFERLVKALEGTTDEVVISFAQLYKKTLKNMNWAADNFGFTWEDPNDEEKSRFVAELALMALAHRMQLSVCSQRRYVAAGALEARCVDAKRLADISGHPINAQIRGNRGDCACYVSRDIGEYDTCPHGCVYCYAVANRDLAQRRFKEHDPTGDYLFRPVVSEEVEEQVEPTNETPSQLPLL